MIRLGIIGTSVITEHFLSAVFLTDRFELSAIYSRTSEKGKNFSKKYGDIPVFTDMSEMTKSGIDAVYIASPNSCHYSQSKLFIENKINVICEKPITCNLNQYEELKALADKNNVIYMEAIMSMYSKGYDIIHNALNSIGKISMARIDFCQRSSRINDFYKGIPQNIFDMSLYAGTLMDLGVYCVYGAVDLFGVPNNIISKSDYFYNGCDCSGYSVFQYDTFSAILTYSKIGHSAVHTEIIGDKGTVSIKSISQYAGIRIYKDGKEKILYDVPERKEVMRMEADAFADFIDGKNLDDFNKKSFICKNVHSCMDKIKEVANIKYT